MTGMIYTIMWRSLKVYYYHVFILCLSCYTQQITLYDIINKVCESSEPVCHQLIIDVGLTVIIVYNVLIFKVRQCCKFQYTELRQV